MAYWAGGMDAKEFGEPITIRIRHSLDLAECVQKAACIQAMNEKGWQRIAMAVLVNLTHLQPLIRGLPDALKIHTQFLKEGIQGAL